MTSNVQDACSTKHAISLLARIELLESQLKQQPKTINRSYFRIEDIESDDKLVRFYTGFVSYSVFVKNFEYLGPVVENLTYWGSQKTQKKRSRKLDTNSPFTLELRTVPEPFQAQCKRMQNRSKPIRFAWIGSTYKCRSRPIQNGYFL